MHIKNTTEIKYRRQSAIHFKGRVPDFPQQRPAALFCRIPAFVVSSLFYIQISFTLTLLYLKGVRGESLNFSQKVLLGLSLGFWSALRALTRL